MTKQPVSVSVDEIATAIHVLRGQRVMLDADLARLYGVETKALNRAVKRNRVRFPSDFTFQVTPDEASSLRYQIGTSKQTGRGGRRYLPHAFTEHGAVMVATVLNSPIAVEASIQVVRAFIQLRAMLAAHADLARKLDELERKCDAQFRVVFDAIRELAQPPVPLEHKRIGFRAATPDDRLRTRSGSAARRRSPARRSRPPGCGD
jgi:hypothetical protein